MKTLLVSMMLVLWAVSASAQVSVPTTFVTGNRILASEVNANFAALVAGALNRTGGTITGNIVVSPGVTIDGIDVGAVLGGTGTPTFSTVTATTFTGNLAGNVTGNLTGQVSTASQTSITSIANLATVGTITSGTWSGSFGAVSGANLTTLNASNIASGTLAIARGGTNGSATPTAGAVNYGTGTAHAFSLAGTAVQQYLVSGGTGSPTWVNRPMVLLAEGEGSSVSATAVDLDTTAISGLTNTDRIVVEYTIRADGGNVAGVYLRNTTDGVNFAELNDQAGSGNMVSGQTIIGTITSNTIPNSSTVVASMTFAFLTSNAGRSQGNGGTFVTNYTGSWSIALRMGGITAGTFYYKWVVYKVQGV